GNRAGSLAARRAAGRNCDLAGVGEAHHRAHVLGAFGNNDRVRRPRRQLRQERGVIRVGPQLSRRIEHAAGLDDAPQVGGDGHGAVAASRSSARWTTLTWLWRSERPARSWSRQPGLAVTMMCGSAARALSSLRCCSWRDWTGLVTL